jgi:predicted ABC-type ATPase
MTEGHLRAVVSGIATELKRTKRPLAVILAGHNGSGKSTLWYSHLIDALEIPLINADRMMLSLLPEPKPGQSLPAWAVQIRDNHASWMQVAQKGVEAFVAQAIEKKVPFAMETVFSHLRKDTSGRIVESKIDKIRQLQGEGYFVLLLFVGLASAELSIARVKMRVANKGSSGHDVSINKLLSRFPRTQEAIGHALTVADAALLVDNSRKPEEGALLADPIICPCLSTANPYYSPPCSPESVRTEASVALSGAAKADCPA